MLAALTLVVLALRPPLAPSLPACVEELNGFLQREDFAAMLPAAQACAEATAHPRTHYFAGIALLALDHPVAAVDSLRRYLASDPAVEPQRLRSIAETRLKQAEARVGTILLRISPASAKRTAAIVVRRGDERPESMAMQNLVADDAGARLRLDPGHYRISAEAAGFVPMARRVVVEPGTGEVILDLNLVPLPPPQTPPPAPKPPPFPQTPWLATTSVSGGAMIATGLPLSVVGSFRNLRELDRPNGECMPIAGLRRCRDGVAQAALMRGTGAGILGAGVGVLAGGLTGLLPRADQRRKAWIVEASLGGVSAILGAALLQLGLQRFNHLNTDASADALLWEAGYKNSVVDSSRMYVVGAGLLGAGIGLGASAATGLLTQRFVSKRGGRVALRARGLHIYF